MRLVLAICLLGAFVSSMEDDYDPMADFSEEDWEAAADSFVSPTPDSKIDTKPLPAPARSTPTSPLYSNKQEASSWDGLSIDALTAPLAGVPPRWLLAGLLIVILVALIFAVQQHHLTSQQRTQLQLQQEDYNDVVQSMADVSSWNPVEHIEASRRLCQRCTKPSSLGNQLEALRDQATLKLLSTASVVAIDITTVTTGSLPSETASDGLVQLEQLLEAMCQEQLGDSPQLQQRLLTLGSLLGQKRLEHTLSTGMHQCDLAMLTKALEKCKTQRLLPGNHGAAMEVHRTLKLAQEMKAFVEARLGTLRPLALGPSSSPVSSIPPSDSDNGFVMVEEVDNEVATAMDEPLIEEPDAIEAMHGILSCVDDTRLERRLQHELSIMEVTQRHAWLRTNFEQVQAERRHRETLYQSSHHHENILQEMRENTATAQADLRRQQGNFEKEAMVAAQGRIDAHHQHVCLNARATFNSTLRNILMVVIVALVLGALETRFSVKNSSCAAPPTGWTVFASFDPIQHLNNAICRVSQFYTPIVSGITMICFIALYLVIATFAGQWPALVLTAAGAYFPLRHQLVLALPRLIHVAVPVFLAAGHYALTQWIARKSRRQARELCEVDPFNLDVSAVYQQEGAHGRIKAGGGMFLTCLTYGLLGSVGWYIAYHESLAQRLWLLLWN